MTPTILLSIPFFSIPHLQAGNAKNGKNLVVIVLKLSRSILGSSDMAL